MLYEETSHLLMTIQLAPVLKSTKHIMMRTESEILTLKTVSHHDANFAIIISGTTSDNKVGIGTILCLQGTNNSYQGPLLTKCINFNSSMDK